MDRSEKWYEYKPEAMIEKDWFKILWDFKIQVKIYLSIEELILSWLKGNKKICDGGHSFNRRSEGARKTTEED